MGGILELAPGYLPSVYSTIRKAGGLCIADEVQSGFARTGSHFWGFEAHGVVPDIVTMAKVEWYFTLSRNFCAAILKSCQGCISNLWAYILMFLHVLSNSELFIFQKFL